MSQIEQLPLELYFLIFEYLAPLSPPGVKIGGHPFLALSQTSQTFRNALLPYLRLQILNCNASSVSRKHQQALADPKRDLSLLTPKLLKIWLNASMKHCFACGKASGRRAIMDSTLVCCVKCDRIIWPQKITMTEAIKKYSIKKEDLFGGVLPSTLGGPREMAETKDGIIPQKQGLRYGQFMQNNTFTTMFMEDDVRRLASKKHGIEDIDDYLNTKSDKCEFRRAKKEENKFKKRHYFHRLAQQNGLDPATCLKRYEYHLFEQQRKCSAISWIRGDLLLKKLGITFVDNFNAPFIHHIDRAPSDSRCYEFLERLMKFNHFLECYDFTIKRTLEWVGDQFRFKRILYLVKSNDPERQGQYDYKDSLRRGVGDLDATYDACNDIINDRNNYSCGILTITGIKDASIDNIPIKNYSADFGSDLEQMIFCRKGYTGEVYQFMDHDTIPKLRAYGIAEWADPIDYCLFEAFIQQFSREGVEPPTFSYAQLRDTWRARAVVEMGDVLESEEYRAFNTPWSWLHYPVYIQDVTYDNFEHPNPPAPTYTYHPAFITGNYQYGSTPLSHSYFGQNARKYIDVAKAEAENTLQEERDAVQRDWDAKREEEQGRVNTRNSAEEAKWLKTEAAIFAVVEKYGWDLLAEDGGRAWERAIRAELAGLGGKVDEKGKGKAKAPRGRR
ncbi:hypothetical protein BGX38DRAFT_1145888 [Terfezia claveryi]|nr:hypothetical protein BGX38DRAFT_1145888 [Terfezia claveryi]